MITCVSNVIVLLFLLRMQFSKLHGDKKQISVGVVGYPNVGKSSIINTLKTKKVRSLLLKHALRYRQFMQLVYGASRDYHNSVYIGVNASRFICLREL